MTDLGSNRRDGHLGGVRANLTASAKAPGPTPAGASPRQVLGSAEAGSTPEQLELTWPGSEWDGTLPVPYDVVPY